MKIGDHDDGVTRPNRNGSGHEAVCSCGQKFVGETVQGAQRLLQEHQHSSTVHGDEEGKTL